MVLEKGTKMVGEKVYNSKGEMEPLLEVVEEVKVVEETYNVMAEVEFV